MKYILGALIACFVILFIINIVDLNRYVVRSVAIYDSKVKKKLKVCFVSDLHNYSCTPKFYEDIKEFAPDVILCGGDTITATKGRKQDRAYYFLKELSKIAPTYTALGNHEYRAKIYPEVYGKMYDEFAGKMEEYGIPILSNSSEYFTENNVKVSSADIDRSFYKRFKVYRMDDDYIESLIGKIEDDKYNILLAHNPDYFKYYNAYGSDLILSGHVHGGLIRLPLLHGVAHPGIRFFPKYSGGVYDENGKYVRYADSYVSSKNAVIRFIVSCGIGFHTLPLRLFNPGELIFITIDSKQ
ncbi:MAG: metallophosphoesterase [Lachnospiraceae bacterium]|nr:metallophosphoesterase [Lachnospiraceae bacterium]